MDIMLLVLCIFLGICFGIFTGLLPGVHINLIAGMILIYLSFFLKFFDEVLLGVFIIVMSVTHTFIDFIPSIIFGVPSSDTAMGVLPGHRLVLEGQGYLAIFLSSIGSLFGVVFLFFLLPVLFLYLEVIYLFVKDYIAYVLILVVVFLILQDFGDKNKFFWSFIIVCFSSALGFLVLNTYLIDDALLVLFTGLFGVASLVFALNSDENSLPLQRFDLGGFKVDFSFVKAVFVGGVTSSVCSVVPGVGNAQAATIVSVFFRKMYANLFIVMLSVINTINFALSIVTFYLISRARNGSILVVSQILGEINLGLLWFYLIIILIAAIFCFFITIFLGKLILKGVSRINLRYVNIFILVSLFLIVFVLTNVYGVLILVLSSSLGLLALSLGVKRIHLMSVLLVPVIFNLL